MKKGDSVKVPEFPKIFEEIDKVFASQGVLAEGLLSYAVRPGQIQMAKLVAETLEEDRILLVEAGTGTGKTLAYLVPSIIWSSENDSKVVISTNTINLQDQIWNHDIPMLQDLLPYKFNAVRIKGRSNYLCLRKWYSDYQLSIGDMGDRGFHEKLETWLNTTDTGDKSELNLSSIEETMWRKFSADDATCHGSRCSWAQECFLRKVRSAAARANIILVNHSLLLIDAEGGFGILPKYSKLIIDEAHNLSGSAVNHFSLCLEKGELLEVYKLLGQISPLTRQAFSKDSENRKRIDEQEKLIMESRSQLYGLLAEIFSKIEEFYSELWGGKRQVRIKFPLHDAYMESITDLCSELLNCLGEIEEKIKRFEELTEEFFPGDVLRMITSELDSVRKNLVQLTQFDSQEQVLWLEEQETGVSIRTAPLYVGNILADILYSRLDSVVLTSATLRLQNSFDYFSEELGLSQLEDVLLYESVQPPFDYCSQAKIFIAGDLPQPNWEKDREWVEACAGAVAELVKICTGSVLALFTSHRHLLQTYELLKGPLAEEGTRVLAHDIDGDRYHLVEAVKRAEEKTLLLGTGSFWEGIDVPGDCLQCVIITKLPFPVPDSPLFEAKVEKLREMGNNPFYKLFLPVCTTKLLQGIGRLIRTEEDFGFVVILDSRLTSKAYGEYIIDSLPCEPLICETKGICRSIEETISRRKNIHPVNL